MAFLSRADLIHLAERVACEVGVRGEMRIEEKTYERAPFGDYAHSDVLLSSSEPDSCPITISLLEEGEADGWVTLSFGGTYQEVWFMPPDETLTAVQGFLAALLRGNYREWRRMDAENDSVYGFLADDEGKVLYSDLGRMSPDKLARRGYAAKTFQPY